MNDRGRWIARTLLFPLALFVGCTESDRQTATGSEERVRGIEGKVVTLERRVRGIEDVVASLEVERTRGKERDDTEDKHVTALGERVALLEARLAVLEARCRSETEREPVAEGNADAAKLFTDSTPPKGADHVVIGGSAYRIDLAGDYGGTFKPHKVKMTVTSKGLYILDDYSVWEDVLAYVGESGLPLVVDFSKGQEVIVVPASHSPGALRNCREWELVSVAEDWQGQHTSQNVYFRGYAIPVAPENNETGR